MDPSTLKGQGNMAANSSSALVYIKYIKDLIARSSKGFHRS